MIELSNPAGLRARLLAQGATLQALEVPDGRGGHVDVVLGHEDPAEYLAHRHYFGNTVGRHANRIRDGRFRLDGREVDVDRNDGAHHLHGGLDGFDRRPWQVLDAGDRHVVFALRSPDGDGGYPGTLDVTAAFRLGDDLELVIEYAAVTDQPTVVNLTHHGYWNLAGAGTIDAHELTLHAAAYVPVDDGLIPTGELVPVAGTAFDFRGGRRLGAAVRDAAEPQLAHARGFDHHFVLDGDAGTLRPAGRLVDSQSGRWMTLETTAPGLQLYTGNFLDGRLVGKRGRRYRQGDGLCLEPQGYPDAPNQPGFPSTRLSPGESYTNTLRLRFGG